MDEKVELQIPPDMKAEAILKIKAHWAEIVDGLIVRAKGIKKFNYDSLKGAEGPIEWEVPPDREAARYLMDQVMGRPDIGISDEEKVQFIMDDD